MNAIKWVLIDGTKGASTSDGAQLSTAVLARIAEAVSSQVNQEFAAEWGAQAIIRVGANANDIQPGEWAYVFLPSLPDAPGASAYHDINGNGVPFSLCAVQTCASLYGPNGVIVRTRDGTKKITVSNTNILIESTTDVTIRAPSVKINP